MRLSSDTLNRLPRDIERFGYRRELQSVGIVHVGVGAFHRAHQAWYTDLAIEAGDEGWGILGVSLRSQQVASQLNPQDGLYSLTVKDSERSSTRVIGALRHVLAATTRYGTFAAISAIASPTTKILTLTVTEKGYADASLGDDVWQRAPLIYPLLGAALQRRQASGLSGLTLLSCDNLSSNGERLQDSLSSYLEETDPDTGAWFRDNCTCPSTVVDRIVPATTAADLNSAEQLLGLRDEAAVITEPFSQWILEDRFGQGRPGWDRVGARLVDDVRPFEMAKLRMLNGAHSALAYLGLERGHRFVDEAIADPVLRPLIEAIIRREAAESFTPAKGQDLSAYADLLVARFSNRGLRHRLDQIAEDGSQKIPQRWLATIADRRALGLASPAILSALGAWVRFVRGKDGGVCDPRSRQLSQLWAGEGASGIAAALFSERGLFRNALTPDEQRRLTDSLRTANAADGGSRKFQTN